MSTPPTRLYQADTVRFRATRDDSLPANPARIPKETRLFTPLRRAEIRSVEQMEKDHFQVVPPCPAATVALSRFVNGMN
ncbi:hypothetical protein [Caballeronia sp. KNU42]